MLKIKDNVDLKELEKFGFDDFGVCYKRYCNGAEIFINKNNKKFSRLHPFSLREDVNYDEIDDLIQANLVEKVSD